MATKNFDAGKYLTDLNGREYLEVKWRLLWLRTEHPDAVIETVLVEHAPELALFKARVAIPGGGEASGWGSETADDFEDFIEKAETKALGRALAALGYGTQFCEDFDFSADRRRRQSSSKSRPAVKKNASSTGRSKVVDAPVRSRGLKAVRDGATSPQVRAIYTIGRKALELDESGVEGRCRDKYGCVPAELSKGQASEFIDVLRQSSAKGGDTATKKSGGTGRGAAQA